VLRSESPGSKRTKLHTLATRNSRDHILYDHSILVVRATCKTGLGTKHRRRAVCATRANNVPREIILLKRLYIFSRTSISLLIVSKLLHIKSYSFHSAVCTIDIKLRNACSSTRRLTQLAEGWLLPYYISSNFVRHLIWNVTRRITYTTTYSIVW